MNAAVNLLISLVVCWLCVGVVLVLLSRSRGLKADIAFIILWPVHYIQFLRGKD